MSRLTVDPRAAKWYEKEFDLEPGYGIRIFGKGYGETNKHVGFSVGISYGKPEDPYMQTVIDGHPYFVEKEDEWFVAGLDLHIGYDEKLQEPTYIFADEEN